VALATQRVFGSLDGMPIDTSIPTHPGYALAQHEGETLWWESQLFRIKTSTPDLGLVDCVLERGSEPPMHVHTREDEFIFVLDGQVSAWIGDEFVTARTGGMIFMPRDIPHTFGVDGDGLARALLFYTPSGFERVFWDRRTADYIPGHDGPPPARHDLDKLGAAFEEAGLTITGPHPRDL
jgi:quercetin dioxygenase-like cupin family protein